jgi:GTPase Era involved in 16S rRNA processing
MEALYNELRIMAEESSLADVVSRLEQTRRQIAENKLRVAFVGKFNHGKSLIINTLLEQPKLLLVGATPTTRVVTEIDYGTEESISYTDKLGRKHRLKLADYYEQNLDAPKPSEDILTITAPHRALHDITFVDTLGLDDPDTLAVERVAYELSRADVVVFVLSASQTLTASEQAFLAEKLPKESQRKIVFVLNQTDRLNDDEELPKVIERARLILRNFIADPVILPYSAMSAAKALPDNKEGLEKANYPEIKKALTTDLIGEKSRLQEVALYESLVDMAGSVERALKLKQTAAQQDPEALEKAHAELDRQVSRLQNVKERIQKRVAADVKRKSNLFIADVDTYARRLGMALPQQLDTLDESHNVAENMPFYLEYAMKQFIEARAEPFQKDLELYLNGLSEEIEKEFSQSVKALNLGDSYFVATMPTAKGERSFSSWLSGGLTVLGATTIFFFGNILLGVAYLVGSEIVRRTLAFQRHHRGNLAEQGQKVLDETLHAVHDKLDAEFEVVAKNVGKQVDHIFAENITVMRTRLDELSKTAELSKAELETLNKRIEQDLAKLDLMREKMKEILGEPVAA